jgi:hypothetical protein
MVRRYGCQRCGSVYRKVQPCATCKLPVFQLEMNHTVFGMLMYVFSGFGLAIVILAFLVRLDILVLIAFLLIILSVAFNIIDDKKVDKAARERMSVRLGH